MTRTEAAKTNGTMSHGPKTQQGKAVSSRNAIKHGLTAAEIVIPGEDPRAFEVLLANIEIDHCATTVSEKDMAMELAAARWRLRRLAIMEKAIIEQEMRRALNDTATHHTPEEARAAAWVAVAESSAMKQIHRHESRLHRHFEKTRAELERITTARIENELQGGIKHPCCPEGPVEQTVVAHYQAANTIANTDVQIEPVPCPVPTPEPAARAA